MKKINLAKRGSLKNFKNEVGETHTLIHALETQIIGMRKLLEFIKAKDHPGYNKFQKLFEVSDKQIKKLYELGFIALFANFECFTFELLKELFSKYPDSFQSDKVAKFEDFKYFKEIGEVRDYFIDSLAIEKSYDVETWANFLLQRFGIVVFKNNKDLNRFKMLNLLRNAILHSGSKTNSKFSNEMRRILKVPVPMGKKIGLDLKKYFTVLYVVLRNLIGNLEKI